MKKSILILGIIPAFLLAYAQQEKIVYIFPDNVEVAANKFITANGDLKRTSYFLFLHQDTEGTFKLFIPTYKPSQESYLTHCVKSSNRVAVIDKKTYSLLFDYDYRFGTRDSVNIGKYGEREGYILRTTPIFEAYTIHFRGDGTIIREGYL